jgi:hypothetical protein
MRVALVPAALLACMIATGAGASCETDLAAAYEATRAAGPVRLIENFTTHGSAGEGDRTLTVVRDIVAPDRMRRITIFQDGRVGETVLIADAGWSSSLGQSWEPLEAGSAKKMLETFALRFPSAGDAGQVSCSTAPGWDGEDAMKFSFAISEGSQSTEYEVLVDPETKRALRYRYAVSTNGVRGIASDVVFQFIASLKVEPPK